jgi:hypothetical protein
MDKAIQIERHQIWLVGCALTLLFAGLLASGKSAAQEAGSDIFVPDYLFTDLNVIDHNVHGEGSNRYFSSFGMSDHELDWAAANFSDNSINTTQRLLNHQWIYAEYHDIEWRKGSKFFSEFLRASAMAYWNHYRGNNASTASANEADHGYNDIEYRLRMKSNSIRFSVKYDF